MAAEPVPAQLRGRLPRWACQTSLFQLREPAFWVYVLLLVGTGLQAVGQQESLRGMSPSGWALSWLLLLSGPLLWSHGVGQGWGLRGARQGHIPAPLLGAEVARL